MRLGKPNKIFSFSTQSLGELDCFPKIYWSDKELRNRLGEKIKDSTPDNFLRALISVSCQKPTLENEVSPPTKFLPLPYEEVANLTEAELENFSHKFLEKNSSLYRKLNFLPEPTKNEDGTVVVHTEYGDAEYPKGEDETNMAYLHRLSVIKEKQESEKYENLSSRYARLFGPPPGFSDHLKLHMEKTRHMGEALQNTIEQIKGATVSAQFDYMPTVNYQDITERAARPYKEMSERLDELISLSEKNISLSAKEGELLVDMNQTQNDIAKELKASGDINTLYAKKNLGLSILVAAFAASSLIISIWTVFSGSNSSTALIQNMNKYTQTIESTLQASANNNIKATGANSAALNELIEQQKNILAELKAIKNNLETKPPEKNEKLGNDQKSTKKK